jgi:hypothetical protein
MLPCLNFLFLLYIVSVLFVVGTNILKINTNNNLGLQKLWIKAWYHPTVKSDPSTRLDLYFYTIATIKVMYKCYGSDMALSDTLALSLSVPINLTQ